MNVTFRIFFGTILLGLCAGHTLAVKPELPASEQSFRKLVYRNPLPDAPKLRVDGCMRSTEDAAYTLTVLTPQTVGLTTKPQPSLYWFQSKALTNRFELIITEKDMPKPLLEARFDATSGGVQRVRLSDYSIRLTEGVEYRWSVAVALDKDDRSKDIVASGAIKYIKPTDNLSKRLKESPTSEAPYIYADEGIWYDSLESLCELVNTKPQDAKLHEIRAVYFMQVGLHEAALSDLKSAGKTASSLLR